MAELARDQPACCASASRLPLAPSCSLDNAGLHLQLERYRTVGAHSSLVERTPTRVVVRLDQHADRRLLDELVAVERACCPFFLIDWAPDRRRLAISVQRVEHEPALDAIASALGL